MKTIRFTQAVELTVNIEALVPDDWTDEDITEFAREYAIRCTVDVDESETEVQIEEMYLEHAEIVFSTVHEETK